MAGQEHASIVFNGDFNWFDIEPAGFTALNETVLGHHAVRGNVETELATDDSVHGCGCGYPEWVGDAEVERSNEIMARLRETAAAYPALCQRLLALPAHLVAEVHGTRIGVVHGDAESLSGWGFSQEVLRKDPQRAARMVSACQVDAFACTHTCLPVLQEITAPGGTMVVANNGAAGMPNFEGTNYGLATRIAHHSSPLALYGTRVGSIQVEAIPVHYDQDAWIKLFDRLWPGSSPASVSYRQRILCGPIYHPNDAMRIG
jgi:hypothetical protein